MNKNRFSILSAAMAMCLPMAMAATAPAAVQNAENHAEKSKFFRVATEGATTDGRTIERAWLQQMAATYNPQKYGARVNVEHIRGYGPNSDFGAYGDVLALETRTVEDGKLALFAQIKPLQKLVELNKASQKIYTSVEISTDFANSGQAYLMGIAVTDSPASLGTEVLQFAAKATHNIFASRKQAAGNLFSEAEETKIELEPARAEDESTKALGMLEKMFSKLLGSQTATSAAPVVETPAKAPPVDEFATAMLQGIQQLTNAVKTQNESITELRGTVAQQAQKIEAIENEPSSTYTSRPTGTGSKVGAENLTDC